MSIAARLVISLISIYQYLSRGAPRHCRFEPTCSNYAAQAVRTHGAVKGMLLAVGRILRCHPLNPGGLDPVPKKTS
jgi:uncharacterized protein